MLCNGNECGKTKVVMNVEESKVAIISRQVSPAYSAINKRQLENMELGSVITNDARCTSEIKSKIVMAKAAFNKKKTILTSILDLNLKKKLVKCYIWSTDFYVAKISTPEKVD
jgi:hypothetical protein